MGGRIAGVPAAADGAARPHAAHHPCLFGQRHLVVADAKAQVYLVPGPNPEDVNVEGCAYGHAPHRLGVTARLRSSKYLEESVEGIEQEVLNGTLVAYEEVATRAGCGFCHWSVVVRDLATGRRVRDVPTGTPTLPAFSENLGVGPTTAIVLLHDGTVAWIVHAGEAEGGYQVHAAGPAGSQLLASGPGIAPNSLAVAGSTLYWTNDGIPAAAHLY